jgi:hypothetical protein
MAAEQRTGWRARLRHAFAVEADGPVEPDPVVRTIVDDLLQRIVKRGMVVPASMLLESWRPMGAVSGQMMHALTPFTERRGAIPWMLDRLVELAAPRPQPDRASGD